MKKRSKRRAWTSVQVRELKSLAKKSAPALFTSACALKLDGAATVGMRAAKLFRNEFLDGWTGGVPLELTGLIVQAPQCTEFFIAAELRFLHGRFEHHDRLVDFPGHFSPKAESL